MVLAPLPPGARGPADAAEHERQGGRGRAEAMLRLEHQRNERLGAEERSREQPAHRDRRRDTGACPHRPGGQEGAQAPRERARAQKRGNDRRRRRMLSRRLERRDAARKREHPERALRVGETCLRAPAERPVGEAAQDGDHERGADEREGQQAEEDPTPARVLGQRPRDDRPDQRRGDPGRRERREDLGAKPGRVGLAEHDVDRRDDQSRPEPLHAAAGDELLDRRGRPRERKPSHERDESRDHRAPRPTPVADLARHDHADKARGEEAGEGPADRADRVELARRGGQRGRDSHRLERKQRHEQHDAATRAAVLSREDRPLARLAHLGSMQARRGRAAVPSRSIELSPRRLSTPRAPPRRARRDDQASVALAGTAMIGAANLAPTAVQAQRSRLPAQRDRQSTAPTKVYPTRFP